ncbi:MAG: glycosyltransferase [Actinomycetota bacterium]|nr:glycosyltransferase [Actinomycetota bacterium]
MKVLLVSNHHGELSGGAVAMMRLTQELVESRGHTTIPFAIREDANLPVPSRAYFPTVRDLRRQPLPSDEAGASPYSFPARKGLRRLVRAGRPDVAHLHNVFSKLTLSVVDALDAEAVPVVMTLHEFKSVCPNGMLFTHDGICHRCLHGRRFWNGIRHRCVEGSLYRSAIAAVEAYVNRFRRMWEKIDVFIAPSGFLSDIVVAAGLPRDRIEVVPNPVHVAEDLQQRSVAERSFFVYSGRLVAQKGLDVLLDAAGMLDAETRIVVYGAGPLEPHLRTRVEREGLPVELRGYADKAVIARDLDRCVASVSPSLAYETCPMAILEAAAGGVATVGSDLGGIPELVKHKETGVLVPPGDPHALASALRGVADDPDSAAELGRAAWKRARARHDPRDHLEALTEIYERALRRRRGAAPAR